MNDSFVYSFENDKIKSNQLDGYRLYRGWRHLKIKGTVNIRVGAIPFKDTSPGPFLDYAAAIKQAVNIPVIAVAKLDDWVIASRALVNGKCDMVALARQLLCDPYWARKVQSGRSKDIVHCKYCMTCHTAQQRGEAVRCAQNHNLFGKPIYKGT